MKILVIEDQEKLARLIRKGLERDGHVVDHFADGESGQIRLEMYNQDYYDVVILDLMLPKRNGYEVCKSVRTKGISTPILILTAKSGLEDKVNLLETGADDYMIKPFEFTELLARLRALTRRPAQSLPTELTVGSLTLSPSKKTVLLAGKEIRLSLTEFRLLEYLMRHANEAVSREDLISSVWDSNSDYFSNIVDVYMNRLRTKLKKENATDPISTIRGFGYKLEGAH